MKYSEERKSERSIAIISSILCECDPIGVITDPTEPNDEYDNYIPAITMKLDKSTNENELANLLHEIVNSYMHKKRGLGPPKSSGHLLGR